MEQITSSVQIKHKALSIQKNTIINLAGAGIPVLVSLLTVPLYLRTVGTARYGVLTIVWVLLGYFGFFDMGLGRATANQVAKLRGRPIQELHNIVWTALLINIGFGILGSICLLIVGQFLLGSIFKMPDDLRPEALSALPWLAIAVPTITVSSVLGGAIEGQERFIAINVLTTANTLLTQIVPLCLAFTLGPNLVWLITSIVVLRYVNIVALCLAYSWRRPLSGVPRFERTKVGELFRYGGWITLTWIVGPLMTTLDQVLLTAVVGVQSLPNYSIPFNFTNQVSILPYSLSRSLFPRFSMLQGKAAHTMSRQATLILAALITPLIIVGIVLIGPFFTIWIGKDFADSAAPVGIILLLGVWFNSLAYIPYTLLQGQGRPDLPAKFHVAELPFYLVMLWLSLQWAGPAGAATAWSLRAIVDAGLLFFAARTSARDLYSIVPGVLLVGGAVVAAFTLFPHPAWHVVVGAGLVITSAIWSWHVGKERLMSFIRRMFGRASKAPVHM